MNILIDILKGAIMGIANVIPGVSGGTLAVTMGIYDKLIHAITHIFKTPIKSIKEVWAYVVGMILGIGSSVILITKLFDMFPLPTTMLFVGLILGSLPMLVNKVADKKIKVIDIICFVIMIAVVVILPFLSGTAITSMDINVLNIVIIFAIGVIAAATMVIPGVSGSMMLMILGFYEFIMGNVSSVVKSLFSLDFATMFESVVILIPFAIGVFVGIFAIAKLIEWLLSKFHNTVFWAILGLVIASPFGIICKMQIKTLDVMSIIISVVTFAIGCYIAVMLAGDDKKKVKEEIEK